MPAGTKIDPFWGPDLGPLSPEISVAYKRLSRATIALGGVDPITSELLRLRNATVHGCHL
jgi:hypothetical protein